MTLLLTVLAVGSLFLIGVAFNETKNQAIKGALLGLLVIVIIGFGFNIGSSLASSNITIGETAGDPTVASMCDSVYNGGWKAYKESESLQEHWAKKCSEFEEEDYQRALKGLPTGEAGSIYKKEQEKKAYNERLKNDKDFAESEKKRFEAIKEANEKY